MALSVWSCAHRLPTRTQRNLTPKDCALAAATALTSFSMQANPAKLDLPDLNTMMRVE